MPSPFSNLALGSRNQAWLHLQATKAEIWPAPMVPKGPNNTHKTQVMMGVNDLISSQRIVNGEWEKCRTLMVFGSHKAMSNSLNSQVSA